MKKSCLILLLILLSCTKEDNKVYSYLDSFPANKYFDTEVLTGNYQVFYGLWKAIGAYSGWGGSFKPNFDFLEIKPSGIYGFVRNDTLIEYGKITPNTDIIPNFPGLPVILDPEYDLNNDSKVRYNMYFELVRKDTLGVYDGYYDGVSILFARSK